VQERLQGLEGRPVNWKALYLRHQWVFENTLQKPGAASVEMRIETTGGPVHEAPRELSRAKRAFLWGVQRDWLARGIIEPSVSAWCSNPHCVVDPSILLLHVDHKVGQRKRLLGTAHVVIVGAHTALELAHVAAAKKEGGNRRLRSRVVMGVHARRSILARALPAKALVVAGAAKIRNHGLARATLAELGDRSFSNNRHWLSRSE
jgi:hypothetical protein